MTVSDHQQQRRQSSSAKKGPYNLQHTSSEHESGTPVSTLSDSTNQPSHQRTFSFLAHKQNDASSTGLNNSVDDIVKSFINDDLSALDSVGDIQLPTTIELPVSPQSTRDTAALQDTPKSTISSRTSMDSIESKYVTNIKGKFRTFGRRIVSTSAAGPSASPPSKLNHSQSRSRLFRSSSANTNH